MVQSGSYEQAVKDFEDEVFKQLMKVAVFTHAEIIKNTPSVTGRLRQSIIIERRGKGEVIIGSNLDYAEPVELGVLPHTIEANVKQALSFIWKGQQIIVKSVQHPGFEGRGMFQSGITFLENNLQKILES